MHGIDEIFGPQSINFIPRKTVVSLERRLSNRMFTVGEQSYEHSASNFSQMFENKRYTSVDEGASINNEQQLEIVQKLPVGKILIYIHNFELPIEYVPTNHCVRV